MTATPASIVPARGGKTLIGQRVALISTLRTWFLYRDEALWAFVGGTDNDRPLEEIAISPAAAERISQANEAAIRAWALAEQIAHEHEQKASTVMRDAINELLAGETPSFLLAVPHMPGSF